jgi:hypothetical protein
MSVADLTGQLK